MVGRVGRRAVDDGAVQRVGRRDHRMLYGDSLAHGLLHLVAEFYELQYLRRSHLQPSLARSQVSVEGATERHVDAEVAEPGRGDDQAAVQKERGHVEEPDGAHPRAIELDEGLDEPGRRIYA